MSKKAISSSSGWRPLPQRYKTITLVEPMCPLPVLTVEDLPSVVSEAPFGVGAIVSESKADIISYPIEGRELEVEEVYDESGYEPRTIFEFLYGERDPFITQRCFSQEMEGIEGGDYSSSDEEYPPYTSENHTSQLKQGELLVGGMPQKKQKYQGRPKGKNRYNKKKPIKRVMVMGSRFPLPPEYITDVTFKRTVLLTAAGLYAYLKSQVNNAFDCFIGGSGTNTNQLTPFRDYYFVELVMGFSHSYELVNRESFPVLCLQRYTNTDIGTPTTTAEQRFNGPFGKSFLIPGAGSQNHKKFSAKHSVPQVVGNKECLQKDSFTGTSTSGPTDLIHSGMIIIGTAALAVGVSVTEILSLRVKFSGLISDTETFDNERGHVVSDAEEDRRRIVKDKLAILMSELHSPG